MANAINNVVVAGPNGSLGRSIVKHLVESGFNVTLLTRNQDKTNEDFPGQKAVLASYDSVDGLVKILQDAGTQDALVVLINRDQLQSQITVMEAAATVGIPHVVPSAFGVSCRDEFTRSLPIWETKVKMEDYVDEAANVGKFSFTGIQTGAFLDWAVEKGVFINLHGDGKPSIFFDGGDVPFSVSIMDDIGRAVAAALKNVEQCRNQWLHMHTAIITQNKLLSYAKEADPGRIFKVVNVNTAELEKQTWEKYNRGERGPEVLRGWMPRATFGKGLGLFHKTDNELLGIRQWNEEDLKGFIASHVK